MLKEDEITKLVKQQIEADEELGEQSGGSGHMSDVSYELNEIRQTESASGAIEVDYSYTVYITTEFTYYPDNPPYEYQKTGSLVVEQDDK